MKIEAKTKFDIGDIVALLAQVQMPQNGRPLLGCVQGIRIHANDNGVATSYFIRILKDAGDLWMRHVRQNVDGCVVTDHGLWLFADNELVAYDPALDEAADKIEEGQRAKKATAQT
jgi:hypothetical protein